MVKKIYKVCWEVSKHAMIEAKNETEAIEKLNTGLEREYEDEMVSSPIAYEHVIPF